MAERLGNQSKNKALRESSQLFIDPGATSPLLGNSGLESAATTDHACHRPREISSPSAPRLLSHPESQYTIPRNRLTVVANDVPASIPSPALLMLQTRLHVLIGFLVCVSPRGRSGFGVPILLGRDLLLNPSCSLMICDKQSSPSIVMMAMQSFMMIRFSLSSLSWIVGSTASHSLGFWIRSLTLLTRTTDLSPPGTITT